ARSLLQALDEGGVVFIHPAINVVEERVVRPVFLRMHQPQSKRLGDPADARAAPAIILAGDLISLPLGGRLMLIRSPIVSPAPTTCKTGGGVDAGMAG